MSSSCSRILALSACLCIAASLFLAVAPAPARAADIPQIADVELEQALALAGSNRPQLQQALDRCQQKPYTMAAVRFLIASLPVVDLGCATGAELVEHVDLAMQARGEFAYGASYDDALWAHYVLPPRVSQEPLSPWRPYFYAQLRDAVKDCATLEEAAIKVNYWCGERVRFQQTQRRDQGPLATLKSGYGRCEEMVIFYIDACRSVSIPARQAYCPYWAVSDNNHAWSEVLAADGRWHYVGACEPSPTLDTAWYGGAVKQAPIIVSVCFGLPSAAKWSDSYQLVNESGEPILNIKSDAGARYCTLNSTANYRRTGLLVIEGPEEKTDAADTPYYVTVHVFNYGAMRLVARVPFTDGSVALELGAGDYLLSSDAPEGPRTALFHMETGTESRIAWAEQAEAPAELILTFPPDPPVA